MLYVGVPYQHCGRNEHGLDCAGLVIRAAHDLHLTDWDEVDYSQQVNSAYLRVSIERFCDKISACPCDVAVGDILLLARWGHPTHLAVITKHGLMVHACNKKKAVIMHSYDQVWRRCTVGVYRWREEQSSG